MKNTITIKEALKQGYEYYFISGVDMDTVHDIRTEAKDDIENGCTLILAEESDFMVLDPESIFDSACQDLFEGAFDNVYGSEEYKLFEKVCQYVTQRLKKQTQSYRETGVELVKG